mgnify:CR=1 FL=1
MQTKLKITESVKERLQNINLPEFAPLDTVILECGKKGKRFDVEVDYEDAKWLMEHNWRLDNGGYVVRGQRIGTYRLLRMHRCIMHRHGSLKALFGGDQVVDHIDNNKLNNKKENLRLATTAQNNKNRRSKKGKLKGVQKQANGWWRATIMSDGVPIYLGEFPTKELAISVYNKTAREKHGDFANLTDE